MKSHNKIRNIRGSRAAREAGLLVTPNGRSVGIRRDVASEMIDCLRAARDVAVRDSEGYQEIIHSVERLGRYYCPQGIGLNAYEGALKSIAAHASVADSYARQYPHFCTSFTSLFRLVRIARNDSVHQGSAARHMTSHAVELALVLEDGLRQMIENPVVSDFMVKSVLVAKLWYPLGWVRHQMLENAFSYLPFVNNGKWYLISDAALSRYLTWDDKLRKIRLAETLEMVWNQIAEEADLIDPQTPINNLIDQTFDRPALVCEGQVSHRLIGIIAPFDLL